MNRILYMLLKKKWGIFAAFISLCGFFFISNIALAASYSAVPVSISGSGIITMEPGEVREVSATFLNNSDVSWYNDGVGYISVYTYDPKYRRSDFDPGTWLGPEQVKRISEVEVAPGEVASVVFELHAPEVEGSYTETFHLAAEDRAWVENGEFGFNINVTKEIPESSTVASGGTLADSSGYSAELTIQSANSIKAKAGTPILITVGFKNTGTKSWSSYSLNDSDFSLASGSSDFAHPSWLGDQLVYVSSKVAPGEVAYLSFALMSPPVNGKHTARFQFSANEVDIEDAFVELPVEVTGGAAAAVESRENVISTIHEDEEPIIRVGILTVDEETDDMIVITTDECDFELRDVQGNLLAEVDAGGSVTAYYSDDRYYFDRGKGLEVSSYGLRFIPIEENAVMEISNFDYRETRNGGYAYNTYRNILELRYNSYKDRVWIINELPIEQYLYGLAETSNISPGEYQKALVTAARTYAYANARYEVSERGEFMHVNAYADDQVYRGYEHEEDSPNIVDAVKNTRGMIVTYDDELAITPYFSRSDGRTRDWSEVWNGTKAWCKSVEVPWEQDGTLWGHGIGMSALGALHMANDGYEWEEILHYFYTDIEIQQWWE